MQNQRKAEIEEKEKLRNFISIHGARSNNLKNITVSLPKNKLIVITGLSGSGKSSLVMDTLYAEGQRRYVESLSSYARQFLSRMNKPDVDMISGICPAIAIEQKVSSSNARSTVGSLTEIYDYLRLLYSRIGKTISPVSGQVVKKQQTSDVVDYICSLPEGSRVHLFVPLPHKKDRTVGQEVELLMQKGYNRLLYNGELQYIQDLLGQADFNEKIKLTEIHDRIKILIDRFVVNIDPENIKRIGDSVSTAFYESEGYCMVSSDHEEKVFSNRFELDGLSFLEPSPMLFNYNNPYGACPKCEGYGRVLGIDPDKVIPDKNLSIYQQAVSCWKGEKAQWWLNQFIDHADRFDFPIHRAYSELTKEQRELLWKGSKGVYGINDFFDELESHSYKIQNRVLMSRYRGKTTCPECNGGRLRKEATFVKLNGVSIAELIDIPIEDLSEFFKNLELSEHDAHIAKRILLEVNNRLDVLCKIGLSYLTLDRLASTLSGGETQRINLTRTLGSNLTNSLYILDEPSVGLHPRDTQNLIKVLKELRDLGNTVVVVEHEEEVIRSADYIVDIGPGAGIHGGELVYGGPYEEFSSGVNSLTSEYISGKRSIPIPDLKRKMSNKIILSNCTKHNLRNVSVSIPLHALTVISGVSGSGKSTLVKEFLYPELNNFVQSSPGGDFVGDMLKGDVKRIKHVELVTQSPIGRSSRSNPVTYMKAYDGIRNLFASQQASKIKGLKPGNFSFNIEGGRCETCKGDGFVTVEMQFLADVNLLCEDCGGKRFKEEVLDVRYKDLNIYDVLSLSVEEGLEFFKDKKDIAYKLQALFDVGLGYVKLGQSSSTLSGGEAQRVKLASFLARDNRQQDIFFIFDEPTTGLHFYDVEILLTAFQALIEKGHTVLVVEHNLDVIRSADWLIDLGPGGGKHGGKVMYQGVPEGILEVSDSYTGRFLAGVEAED
jgi:excinuclease ABC subunit A